MLISLDKISFRSVGLASQHSFGQRHILIFFFLCGLGTKCLANGKMTRRKTPYFNHFIDLILFSMSTKDLSCLLVGKTSQERGSDLSGKRL